MDFKTPLWYFYAKLGWHLKESITFMLYYNSNLYQTITNEIPMREYSHQPQMIMWVFHQAIKKQIIN